MKKKIVICIIAISLAIGIFSGCTEQEQKTALKAKFEYTPEISIYKDTSVTFTDKSEGENIISWKWDFSDGETSTLQNPIHQFEEIGTYIVKLTVLNSDGENNTAIENITVELKPPEAKFNHPTEDIYINELLNFTDASIPGDSNITSWLWDFGDGTTSTDKNTSHTYTSEDQYTITLKVTDINGLSDEASVKMSLGIRRT